jgi:hypothetical protein
MVSESGGPAKPVKPKGLETPGLVWRPRTDGWIALWSPRSDLVARGLYPKRTHRLWPRSGTALTPPEPTREEWEEISSRCERYQFEMLNAPTARRRPCSNFPSHSSAMSSTRSPLL